MAVKIAVTPEYEDEKRQFHSNRLLMFLLLKKLTAFSDIFFNFWRLCTLVYLAKFDPWTTKYSLQDTLTMLTLAD